MTKKKASLLSIYDFPSYEELQESMISIGKKCTEEKEKTEMLLRQTIREMTSDIKPVS